MLACPSETLVTPPISPPLSGMAASALPRAGAVLVPDWYFSEAAPIFFIRAPRLPAAFPNAKHDDQVNSTVFALAWSTTQRGGAWGWIEYARREAEKANVPGVRKPTRVLLPATVTASHLRLSNGQMVMVPEDRVVLTDEMDVFALRQLGARLIT